MRLLIPAAGALLLSILGFAPGGIGAALGTWRDAGLVLLTAALAWQGIAALRASSAAARATPTPPAPPPPSVSASSAAAAPGAEALVLLSLLQEKGRFLDFVSEDIAAYGDAQVAAASRVVHQGCSAVLRECFTLAPTHAGAEGDQVSVDAGADPGRYRLVGRIAGAPPYQGTVVHRGWKTTRIALPRLTRAVDAAGDNVITPVDVELR